MGPHQGSLFFSRGRIFPVLQLFWPLGFSVADGGRCQCRNMRGKAISPPSIPSAKTVNPWAKSKGITRATSSSSSTGCNPAGRYAPSKVRVSRYIGAKSIMSDGELPQMYSLHFWLCTDPKAAESTKTQSFHIRRHATGSKKALWVMATSTEGQIWLMSCAKSFNSTSAHTSPTNRSTYWPFHSGQSLICFCTSA